VPTRASWHLGLSDLSVWVQCLLWVISRMPDLGQHVRFGLESGLRAGLLDVCFVPTGDIARSDATDAALLLWQ
jgi:hypothetical protein